MDEDGADEESDDREDVLNCQSRHQFCVRYDCCVAFVLALALAITSCSRKK